MPAPSDTPAAASGPRQIQGFLRFSFFGGTDTKNSFADREAAFARLYDPERMETRFHLFEKVCLPSIRAQTDPDFRLVVLSSAVMPAHWQDRLRALTQDIPQIVLDLSDTMHARRALGPHIAASMGPDRDRAALQFRLDDDDALGAEYIATLRRIGADAEVATHITFPKGVAAYMHDGQPRTAVVRKMCTAQGLAMVVGPGFTKNPFQMMHGDVWQRFRVISEPRIMGYIRSYHPFADTLANQERNVRAIEADMSNRRGDPVEKEAHLVEQFAAAFPWTTPEALRRILAATTAPAS